MKQGFECNQYLNKEPCFFYIRAGASLVSTDFLYVHIYLCQCWHFQDDSLIDWLHENTEQAYKVNGPEGPVFIRQRTFDAFFQVY